MGGCLQAGIFCLFFCCALIASAAVALRPNKDCLDCHEDKELTKTNAQGRTISLYVDAAVLARSVHRTNLCMSCHADITERHPDDGLAVKPARCETCHAPQTASFGASVHGLALQQGKQGAPGCADCHGKHDILPPTVIDSPLHWSKLGQTCGECHPEAAAQVKASVHGRAVARGVREAATCTDCHSEHRIETLKGSAALKVSGDVCGKCHASERINSKFRLPANRVKTFYESYHGLAVQSGYARAANCSSCHGYHEILPSTDPRSSIHPRHLPETCGKCHPGATAKFVEGKIHVDLDEPSDLAARINFWVRRIYLALIFGLVGAMLIHNALAWLRKLLALRQAAGPLVERMDRHQRWQHGLLLLSFVVLAVSGFALKFPESRLAWLFGADEEIRRWVHRVAGIVLLGVGLWHLLYLAASPKGRQLWRDLLWRAGDLRAMAAATWHWVTGRGTEPKAGRFGYVEKIEYWAVIWGSVIMGVTGLVIWFKMEVTHWLPRWVIEVATTIHYYEAILACLAIVVWHFYHVIFDPDVYPMNLAWWDGRVPKRWLEQHHPQDPALRQNPEADKKDTPKNTAAQDQ
jgi:formate dehydrogenase gamma subunit